MLILQNVTLIDGTGRPPMSGVSVMVRGDRIAEVTQAPVHGGAGDWCLDLTGCWLMPGLIDAHTHLGSDQSLDRPANAGRFQTYDYARHREEALRWGITTVRSGGDFSPDVFEVRRMAEAGELRSPRILAAGRVLQARNGHPGWSVYFGRQEILEHVCQVLDPDSDVEEAVRRLAAEGADWIKAFVSDDNVTAYPAKVPRLSLEQLRRIVNEAHRLGLSVMMHVDDLADLSDALEAGADTIEHVHNPAAIGPELTRELIDRLKASGTWLVPTLVATKLHDGTVAGGPLVWPRLLEDMKRLVAAGVPMGVGCDSGIPLVPYGECLHMELELLVEAGMTPLEAVTAATGGNARMLRRAEEFGTVRPGLSADLVAVAGDPLKDIRNTRSIRLVISRGRIVFQS